MVTEIQCRIYAAECERLGVARDISIQDRDAGASFDQTPDDEPTGNVDATLAAVSMEGHQAVLSVAILVCDIRGFSSMAEKLTERERELWSELAKLHGA
jgi:class 3 adenylate cyclase